VLRRAAVLLVRDVNEDPPVDNPSTNADCSIRSIQGHLGRAPRGIGGGSLPGDQVGVREDPVYARIGEMTGKPLELLERYVAPRGPRPWSRRSHIEDGFALGHWVAQASLRLPAGQARTPSGPFAWKKLPGWRWTLGDDRWRPVYDVLLRPSHAAKGHASGPPGLG